MFKNSLFINSTKFFFENIYKSVCNMVAVILIINYLDPASFGELSISLTVFAVLAAFASFGSDSILFRNFLQAKYEYLNESISLRLIVATIIFFVIFGLGIFFKSQIFTIITFLCAGLFFDAFLGFREFNIAKKNYNVLIFSEIFGSTSLLLATLIIIFFELSPYLIFLPFLVSRVVFIVALIVLTKLNSQSFSYALKFQPPSKELLVSSAPMLVVSMAGLIYAAQDQWMISYFLDKTHVGIYSAGIKIVTVFLVLPTIITNLLYHKMVSGPTITKNYISPLYTFFLILGLCFFILLTLFSDKIITLLYPDSYSSAATVISIYSFILLTTFFQSLNTKILILRDLQHLIMTRVVISVFLNFIFNIYLIPNYGITGAAVGTLLSEFFILFSYLLSPKTRDIFFFQMGAFNIQNIKKIKTWID